MIKKFANLNKIDFIYLYLNLIIYCFTIFIFVYQTSKTLQPYVDEIVSITANLGFFFDRFNFEGPRGTIYQGIYSPFLTSPPLSAVGTVLSWKLTNNFYLIRFSNFLWVFGIQIIFNYFISKNYKIYFYKINLLSGFALTSFPFWFGSLYSLGEASSIIIFLNSILLYKFYPRIMFFLVGLIPFFGKIILTPGILIFIIFSLFTTSATLKNKIINLIYFLTPTLIWFILILSFSKYKSVYEYFLHFNYHFSHMNSQVGSLNIIDVFNFNNIVKSFENSEAHTWSLIVKLRLFLPPILLFLLVVKNKGKDLLFELNQLTTLIISLLPVFGWFVFIALEKPIIYSAHFTYPCLFISCLFLLNFPYNENTTNFVSFFIMSLFFNSGVLFVIAHFLYFFINLKKYDVFLIILILINLNFINGISELQEKTIFDINIEKCKKSYVSYECFDSFTNTNGKYDFVENSF